MDSMIKNMLKNLSYDELTQIKNLINSILQRRNPGRTKKTMLTSKLAPKLPDKLAPKLPDKLAPKLPDKIAPKLPDKILPSKMLAAKRKTKRITIKTKKRKA